MGAEVKLCMFEFLIICTFGYYYSNRQELITPSMYHYITKPHPQISTIMHVFTWWCYQEVVLRSRRQAKMGAGYLHHTSAGGLYLPAAQLD